MSREEKAPNTEYTTIITCLLYQAQLLSPYSFGSVLCGGASGAAVLRRCFHTRAVQGEQLQAAPSS